MEVFIRSLSFHATGEDVMVEIENILRGDDYLQLWESFPINLDVRLRTKNIRQGVGHKGTGTLTIAVESAARRFLEEYGGEQPLKTIHFLRRQAFFGPSRFKPKRSVLDKLERPPYVDPRAAATKQRRIEEAEANQIPIRGIEFGWECRDAVFSCEWEKILAPPGLFGYEEDKRKFRVVVGPKSIALRLAQLNWVSCGMDGPLPVIFFSLESAPIFEEATTDPQSDSSPFKRTRVLPLILNTSGS